MAAQAIESVAHEDFDEFENGNWRNAVPTGDPPAGIGFDSETWVSEAKKIKNRFNNLLKPNGPVRPLDTDYALFAEKPLRDYQRFLAELARGQLSRKAISKFRSGAGQ